MKGYKTAIEQDTLANENFRKVLYTGKYSQLVLMSLKAMEEIGMEKHDANDQFIRIEGGKGVVVIDGAEHEVSDGDAVVIPAGAEHNVINRSESDVLKLYTLYSPPAHIDTTVHKTKADADAMPAEFDGKTTE